MAIKYEVSKFPVAKQGNLLATNFGEHMISFEITEDTPNGYMCKIGKMKALDLFEVENSEITDVFYSLKKFYQNK